MAAIYDNDLRGELLLRTAVGSIRRFVFGKTQSGETVFRYCLKSAEGLEANILSLGAILQDLRLHKANQDARSLTIGYDTVAGYEYDPCFIGAPIGPYAGRIENARIGAQKLDANHGVHCLHGGSIAFHHQLYSAKISGDSNAIKLTMHLSFNEQNPGFPASYEASISYEIGSDNTLKIVFSAEADKPTWINMTHHAYFNLASTSSDTIDKHFLKIPAAEIMVQNKDAIPNGAFETVTESSLDFRAAAPIGDRVIDHDFRLGEPGVMGQCATLVDPEGDIEMTVYTDQPSLHVYTADFLTMDGMAAPRRAICLEVQDYPNAPNISAFPSTSLAPGQAYERKMILKIA